MSMQTRTSLAIALLSLAAAGCAGGAKTSLPQTTAPQGAAHQSRLVGPTTTSATVTLHSSQKGAVISNQVLGANMAVWWDVTQSGTAQSFSSSGFKAVRWPGGSDSDAYHWQSNSLCAGGYANSNDTFDNFMQQFAVPAHLSVSVTLNYGSNIACNAGGDPTEAAAWVDYANNTKNYKVKYWTVGNEEYGSWEYDLHSKPHDAATYANAVATGFYPDIKAKDPSAQVGVVVEPGWNPAWDPTVLASAKYDFVELHYYAQTPGQETDSYLLTQAPQALTSAVQSLQTELKTAGKATTPIYLGELGSVYANPGKQSTSITQSLFAGQVLAELMNDGVFRSTWWLGYGGCSDSSNGNFSDSLYGWQNFGGYMMFSDGTPEYGCPNATETARGTRLPTIRPYQLLAPVAKTGEHMLAVSLGGSSSNIRAYGLSHGSGYALVLFNLDENNPADVTVSIDSLASGSATGLSTYDKAQYDKSKNNVWAGLVKHKSGAWKGSISLSLPIWSMNVLTVDP
jgi:hypothetical protein